MKNLILAFCLMLSSFANAYTKVDLELPKTDAFEAINATETYLLANADATAADVVMPENLEATIAEPIRGDNKTPIFSAFWWGCCFSVVGLAFVYLYTDNDRPQVKSALVGCLLAALVFGGGLLWDPLKFW